MFKNRIEAGLFLAAKLKKYKNDPSVILAVPRGGVPVAYTVAKELDFPMEIILTKKIGHPLNKEYAIGAASLTNYFVLPHKDVTDEYIQSELKRIRIRLKEMKQKFMGDKEPENLMGKTVIIVDDGMATGNTILNSVNVIRKSNPKKIVVAVPVASPDAIKKLSIEVDEVITVFAPATFYGVGAFYDNFMEVNDDEVLFYLDKMHKLSPTN
ncbi:phosphoribosyltransferase [Pedobacter cryophilus]|uniref:Phosphoribosyltransferase n=1 Tax=Pedobacter cryophilus TaxID=2571271 RepID=A0A4V5NWY4_9SPHI|nr:phosphoribosyltransferase family protein [Pedobacter cryophilus]TKB96900.1 phosphoribosyltransferase [Pedobacter cryophilus]